MLLDILLFTGVVFCFSTAFLIWFRFNKNNSFHGHLLALLLFLIALCNSFYLLIVYGIINYFPFLYKIPAPITYLIFPLAYLYMRAVLNGEKSFRKTDIVHLVPFLFFLINYFPFYLMNLAEKRQWVFEVSQNFALTYLGSDGFLPEWVNIACRALASIIYLTLQWNLIRFFFRKRHHSTSNQFGMVKRWVYDFTIIQTVHSVSLVILYVVNVFMIFGIIPSVQYIHYALGFLVNGSFLLVSAYLLWNPKLLIGMPELPLKKERCIKTSFQHDTTAIFERLDAFLRKGQVFLESGLTLNTVSDAVDITMRRISYAISTSQYDNFNDYINRLRIEFATDRIQNGYLNQYSVDALSKTSGFRSKNAFYRAFKKVHGCTPARYQTAHNTIRQN